MSSESDDEVESYRRLFKKSRVSKKLKEEACQEIASFFIHNGIPFNVARSDQFRNMLESVARHGVGFCPPMYHEIRGTYLKQQLNSTREAIQVHKANWKKTGCTIMVDGWIDKRQRTMINFSINSSKGTVFWKSIDASHIITKSADKIFKMIDDIVEEVGEENVVQIVTDNTRNFKAAGEMLMEKRKRLYWTPCATHCIDLILGDFEKYIPIHQETIPKGKRITAYIHSKTSLISLLQYFAKGKDLVRPAMTCFATSYLNLGCLNNNKGALMTMFTSNAWKSSQFARTKDGKFIKDVVMDEEFWEDIVICLRCAYPLIKVIRLVDSDRKSTRGFIMPAMGFIFEEMNKAKEQIKSAFNGVQESYMPLWDIIDERWHKQFQRPLHAAGYYLNPQLYYRPGFKADIEVEHELFECVQRMVGSVEEITKIKAQLENFKSQSKFFGSSFARAALDTKDPLQWWDSYGFEHPELENFAIRVLSLTCSSSECDHSWKSLEMVHTKRRNHLKEKRMNDVVFVTTNSKLAKKKQFRKAVEYNLDNLSSDDECIAENKGSSTNSEDLDIDSWNLELDTPNGEDLVQVGGEHANGDVGKGKEDAMHHSGDENQMEDDDSDDEVNYLLDDLNYLLD